jgi:long-chain fatty acid transport protein
MTLDFDRTTMKRNFISLCALLILPITLSAIIAAPKAMGRGLATQATPLDTLSAAYNPAVMGFLGNRFDLGFSIKREQGSATISDNLFTEDRTYNSARERDFYFPDFGVNAKACDCNMSVGLLVYSRFQNKTTYKEPIAILGTTPPSFEYRQQTLAPSFAISFGSNHCLGITADIVAHRVKIEGIERFATPFFSERPSKVTNLGYDYAYGIGGTVGWISYLNECVSFGVSYSPEIQMTSFDKYKGFLAKSGRVNIPERIAGGIAVQVLPQILIAFDVEHLRIREVPAFTNPLENAFSQIYAGDEESLFGEEEGPGFGHGNRLFFRVGAEIELNSFWQIRAGYQHSPTPVKSSQTYLNLLIADLVEDLITCGFSYSPCCNHELTFFMAHGIEHKVCGKDAIPFGSLGNQAGIIGGGNCALKGKYDIVGISWGKEF